VPGGSGATVRSIVVMPPRSAPVPPVRGGITTIDLTVAPLPPGTLSSTTLELPANGVDVRGTLAAIAVGYEDPGVTLRAGAKLPVRPNQASPSEIELFDVTNPVAPAFRGRTALQGLPREVRLTATHAYVAALEGGVQVVDIANPTQPVAGAPLAGSSGAESLALTGSLLHVAAGGGGLITYDLSNPISPRQVGTLPFDRPVVKVAAGGTLVALAEEGALNFYGQPVDSDVHLIDVRNPAAPVLVSTTRVSGDVRSLLIAGQQLYVASAGVSVFDISTPSDPHRLSSPPLFNFETYGLAASATRVVAAGFDFTTNGFAAVIDPSGPTRLPIDFLGGGAFGLAVAIDGPYAVVIANGQGRMFVIKYAASAP